MSAALDLPHVESDGLSLSPIDGAPGRVRFTGIGEGEGSVVLERFLGLLHDGALAARLPEVSIDLEQLDFVNSSCLKAMVAWIYKVETEGRPYKIRFLRDAGKHWQRTSLATLQRLAPDVVVIQDIQR